MYVSPGLSELNLTKNNHNIADSKWAVGGIFSVNIVAADDLAHLPPQWHLKKNIYLPLTQWYQTYFYKTDV